MEDGNVTATGGSRRPPAHGHGKYMARRSTRRPARRAATHNSAACARHQYASTSGPHQSRHGPTPSGAHHGARSRRQRARTSRRSLRPEHASTRASARDSAAPPNQEHARAVATRSTGVRRYVYPPLHLVSSPSLPHLSLVSSPSLPIPLSLALSSPALR